MTTKWKIYNEDAVEWAKNYQKGKFHAMFCDTPYNLESITKRFGKNGSAKAKYGTDGVFQRSSKGFMNSVWDTDVAFRPETWEAFGEVLYPGAFGMAFSASRNWHRMAVAIEDAGFILHPTIFLWAYGQGFPKATNISKQIDKQDGLVGEVIGEKHLWGHNAGTGAGSFSKNKYEGMTGLSRTEPINAPATEMSARWIGHRYGLQALKPAVEPIIVFQKPYEGKPLSNIVETGAGALNIEAARIPTQESVVINRFTDGAKPWGNAKGEEYDTVLTMQGRWPSNLLLTEESAERLDAQTGKLTSGKMFSTSKRTTDGSPNGIYGKFDVNAPLQETIGDSGGASRFFYTVQDQLDESDPVYYCGKVSPKERGMGLEEKNNHPTLKPLKLCEYLAKLLLPPIEYAPRRIFIPFSGVASEMIGAGQAGWEHVVGVEFDKDNGYVDIAEKRMKYWMEKNNA